MFFGIVDRIFHFGAKHSQNLEKLELQNGRKAELLVISPLFKRCTSRYAEFSSLCRHLLAIEQGVFGSLVRN